MNSEFNWKRCHYLKRIMYDDNDLLTGTQEPTSIDVINECTDRTYKPGGLNVGCDETECNNPNRKHGRPKFVTGN